MLAFNKCSALLYIPEDWKWSYGTTGSCRGANVLWL